MRLGILGGTFDPIHCGHLKMAEYCHDKLQLNKIYFIPAGNPPHKKPQAPFDLRVQMLHLALKWTPLILRSANLKNRSTLATTPTHITHWRN